MYTAFLRCFVHQPSEYEYSTAHAVCWGLPIALFCLKAIGRGGGSNVYHVYTQARFVIL